MFKIISAPAAIPDSWPVDPNATFQPGMLGQLYVMGNQVVMGVSNGSAPIAVLDDIKTIAFWAPAIDEIVLAEVPNAVPDGYGNYTTPYDVKMELINPNVMQSSFVSDPVDVVLNSRNGIVTFIAGTKLNSSSTDSGIPDSIRTRVSYTYQVPGIPGENTTIGSGRTSVWWSRMRFQTDQFDTSVRYPINALLYSTINGLWTTRQAESNFPAIGICVNSPTALSNPLEIMFL